MKHLIFKGLLLLLMSSLALNSSADNRKDYTKTIKKEFDITSNGQLEIDNKFGQVDIKTWDKKRIKIAVTVIVRANSEKEAQPIFDRISVDFSNGRDYVRAETEIKSQKSSWWGWSNWNNGNDYAINYDVYMPETVRLDLSNKHGEAIIAVLKGDAAIDITHGNITAEGFEGELDLELTHSNGSIVAAKILNADLSHSNIRFKKIGRSDLETAHCTIDIDKIELLRLDSRHTNFEMGEIGELRADSRHDDFEIEYANIIFSEAQHTQYDIDKVGQTVDFDFSHGGASIDLLENGFQEVTLHGSHADYRIRVDDNATYQLDAAGNHAGISYPNDLDVTYEMDKNSEQEIKGRSGNSNAKGFGIIKARLSHGGLRVR